MSDPERPDHTERLYQKTSWQLDRRIILGTWNQMIPGSEDHLEKSQQPLKDSGILGESHMDRGT